MEFQVSRIGDKIILSIAFLAGQKCGLFLDEVVLAWRSDTNPLVNKDGNLLANKVQLQKITKLPPGMEAQLCYIEFYPNPADLWVSSKTLLMDTKEWP